MEDTPATSMVTLFRPTTGVMEEHKTVQTDKQPMYPAEEAAVAQLASHQLLQVLLGVLVQYTSIIIYQIKEDFI